MADDSFGLRIGVEGEADFRAVLREINQSMKVLGSEMQLVTSQFDKNDNSVQALTSRNEVLNKEIDAQKQKIDTLRAALDNAASSFGESDRRTQNWQIQLNKAEAELNNMERELSDSADESDNLGDKLEEAGDSAEKSGSSFSAFGSILKGIGATIGAVAVSAAAAAVSLGKQVVEQFGELEQSLGGSEAVFGKYAASVQQAGEEAYKNLGVSQSEYLAAANKMGALLQGSGIEQSAALELTEKAMQRAADVASVMGIDVDSALEAVTGAAKSNYEMMDNLGVAMNATTLQAYALANGLDITWDTATNAEKAQVAMQMFFEQTEQYAGNFAKESTETISGSIGLLEAALGSFTTGLGNAGADMTNLTQNLVDAFAAVVSNIVPVLENIVASLPPATNAILTAIGDMLPLLIETVTGLFEQVLETLLSLLPELIPVAVDAILTVVNTIIENLPLIIDAAVQLITSLANGLTSSLPELIPAAVDAVTTIVSGLVDNLPMLLDAALQLITGLANGLIEALPQLIAALPAIITNIVNFLAAASPQIAEAGFQLLVSLVYNLPAIITELVKAVPQIVTSIISAFKTYITNFIDVGTEMVRGIWQGISEAGSWLWDKITGFMSNVVANVKSYLGINSPSTVFAGIGRNMGEGIGIGFEDAMSNVSRDMQNAIPTRVDVGYSNGSNNVNGLPSGASITQNISVVTPKALSEKELAREFKNLSRKLAMEY